MNVPFALPPLLDLVLLILAVEVVALVAARRFFPHVSLSKVLPNIAAGACLVMVARVGLRGDEAQAALWLAGAGLAHTLDLVMRLR